MSGHLVRRTFLVTALLVVGAGARVEAQAAANPSTADLDRARAQFGQGVAMAEQGRWEEAVSLFRQVLAVRRAPPVVYNLAHALFELGEFAEAGPLLDEVLADPSTPPSLHDGAEQLRAQMERTGGRLTVNVTGGGAGVVTLLDYRVLDPARVGEPLLVSAGRHVVTAEQDGVLVGRAEGDVPAGGAAVITVTVAGAPQQAVAASAPPSTEDERVAAAATPAADEEAVPRIRRWQLWTGIGAGVLAVALAVGIGVAAGGSGQPTHPYSGNLAPAVLVFQ